MAYKVFISHSSADTWVAEQIEAHIQHAGAQTFLDSRHILHGDDFDLVIFNELKTIDELLVLLTPAAMAKHEYIWSEIGAARVRETRIVAVLYGVSLNEISAKPVISRNDVVEINDLKSHFTQLKARIHEKDK